MANLQRKPALHLSVAPGSASPTPSTSQAGSFARRVGSWGSATSETYHTLSAYGDQRMAPLPSPLEGREWGFFGGEARNGGGSDAGGAPGGGNWQSGWNAASVGTGGGRSRASSVFEEFRDPSLDFGRSVGRPSVPGASARTDSWVSAASNHHGAGAVDEFGAFPSTSPVKNGSSFAASSADADADGRREPARSKTLSFFDDEMSRALSPPLNPPSRNNSLNHRSTNGPRPSSSSTAGLAAPLPPSPGWEKATHDPLRSSIASSSGGSWLDEAAGGSNSWMRGRGGSIGSVASTDAGGWQAPSGALTPRRVSPSRPLGSFLDGDEASPLHDLRPRLAALNTSSPSPSSGFASPSPHSLPHKPLSSLPSAVEPGPRSRFLDLGSLGSRTNSPSPSAFLNNFVALDDAPSPASSGATTPAGLPASRRPARDLDVAAAVAVAAGPPISSPREDEGAPLQRGDRVGDYVVERVLGTGSFSRVALARLAKGKSRERESSSRGAATPTGTSGSSVEPGLVALKLLLKKTCEANERMRISVMREVEVLKNIQHPSLVSLSSSFSTPVYTALVLDYCPGGELFDFLGDWHQQVSEGLARRMFGELCSAVGWMHEVGLVHRDIKLENILLTCRPFPCASPSTLLSSLPTPFVKLTDFGLSRFINPASPLLATRCGSEEYAAPELIMGKKYDGRQTDAWALGVVLFAIITGVMPFVEATDAGPRGRKAYLLKIAKADYRWPGALSLSRAPSLSASTPARPSHLAHGASASEPGLHPSSTFDDPLSAPPTPSTRFVTPAVQVLVGRLLVRDPAKRATVRDVWDSEWMDGEGRPPRVRGTVRGVEAAQGPAEMPEWSRRGSEFLDD
ncbi:uncharacterized protein RHOBADRAFT_53329 [Rhodotorula graminis WP1]|uniref:Protein kinase domain-containing protein n=1 Tax=Rhodotorula graminis (strain WP1) TaxID=578459 RepID=A0A194S492_RHOGW|nr:uncharacterized protein RHOBADRAFT_53329 [Rhodotorula graminis WP1]KPV75340.1 hypothetical protein RHOBADRAFT_53329 [Rhodotorula graminis WP1]